MSNKSPAQSPANLDALHFDEDGLLPAVIQDWRDGTVLMVGFMNKEAVRLTVSTRDVHFWSRSRRQLWKKGETSGHFLRVKQLFVDCDQDTVLVKAEPVGPTCHTGRPTCFFSEVNAQGTIDKEDATLAKGGILERLYDMVIERKTAPREGSYVSSLLQGGTDRLLKKVTEESGEVLLAVKNDDKGEIVHEVADLLFHTIVALGHAEVPISAIHEELGKRFGKPGVKNKSDEASNG